MITRYRCLFLLGLGLLINATGCSNVLSPPMRVGVTSLKLSPLPPFLPKRVLFRQDLSSYLNENVTFELMTPRQIRVHLGTGRLQFAMLTAADYADVHEAGTSRILAIPQNVHNDIYRRGLIIVSPKSDITDLDELAGKRFHFLPADNILNEAALGALLEAGIDGQQIDRGILGLKLDTTHINSLEVAKSVVLENTAGIIDEADYLSWPESGGSFVLLRPSREQVRVIGRTVRIPEGPFVVSNETSAELADQVRQYLLEVAPKRKLVLGTLGCTGFSPPIDLAEYEPYFRIHRRLQEAVELEELLDEPEEPSPLTTQPVPESTVQRSGPSDTAMAGSHAGD